MTHPDVERIRNEILEAERVGYVDGDVSHNLQPFIGRLRRAQRDGDGVSCEDLQKLIDVMLRACQAEKAFLAQKDPDKVSEDLAELTTIIHEGLLAEKFGKRVPHPAWRDPESDMGHQAKVVAKFLMRSDWYRTLSSQ